MRKIYPSPFNKFAIFVLYSLLSIAVITLAQENNPECVPTPMTLTKPQIMIGYVPFYSNPDDIPWELYDYINVIAYPPEDAKSEWNDLFLPDGKSQLMTMKNLVYKKSNAKVLLSLRNYDIKDWSVDGVYEDVIEQTILSIKSAGLDGVDIEYPGMRGTSCLMDVEGEDEDVPAWDKQGRDVGFSDFIRKIREEMDKLDGKKYLMLTVGRDPIMGLNTALIDYFNIEIQHFSLFENLKTNPDALDPSKAKTYPNIPLDKFDEGYNNWINTAGIASDKIIMGIDFGNTFQLVSNSEITKTPSVIFIPKISEDFKKEDQSLKGLKKINLCAEPDPSNDKFQLYSFPWKDLSKSVLDPTKCVAKSNWYHNFDDISSTPWLYRIVEAPDDYQYISYEDYKSLNEKLIYATSKSIGGMSIRDIDDDDSERSLVKYMQVIRGKDPIMPPSAGEAPPTNSEPGNGTTSNNPSTSDPGADEPPTSGEQSETDGSKPGTIIGAIIGSLLGASFIIMGGLFLYRNRNQPKSSSFKSLLSNFKANPSSMRNHNISGNPEMTDPSSNRFAAVPSTTATVIPIASGFVTAMFDFTGKEENDLSFKKGDKIEVLERGDGPNDWWVGRVNGAVGEFPGNYVKET